MDRFSFSVGGFGANLTALPPAEVDAYDPVGCSPTGACDLVGNTWEMTDAFVDQHNRAVVRENTAFFEYKEGE